jgi:hypothetical protein
VTYDESSEEVTIEYSGDETVPSDEITVTVGESEVTPFDTDLTTGDSATIDVSGESDGTQIEASIVQYRVDNSHSLHSWDSIMGVQDATPPSVSSGSLQMPDHQLTEMSREFSKVAVISRE